MKRILRITGLVVGLGLAYMAAHCALIETGREVIVLHTQNEDGTRLETRLWVVDDRGKGRSEGGGVAWLHGDARSRWQQNLAARPEVEVTRSGETHRYRATQVPGPHPQIDALLREKYGVADMWVRFVAGDGERTMVVRLERAD